jgi:hypothetical protein
MKYAITGHTSGIGKRVYERLSPNIIGFSRTNGYNIQLPDDRQRILNAVQDCDVFINCANDGFSQTLLFLELHDRWKSDCNKTIINVGSRIAEVKCLPANRSELLKYQAEKLIIKEMSARVTGQCKVNYRWFGYVGTLAILAKYPHFTEVDYISEDSAVDIILS